jgi:hypothetical protein
MRASRVIVTPRYFESMGIAILDGRAFTDTDRTSSQRVAVVGRSLARVMWGATSPVGRQIESFTLSGGWQPSLVVGVAEDVRSRVIERAALDVYVPHGRGGLPLSSYVVRHPSDRVVTDAMVRSALGGVDPDLAVSRVQTTRAVVDRVLAPSRILAIAMNMLGATGLTLLALGIFGAAAATLRAARREIAVRQAIGATPFVAARTPLRSLFIVLLLGATIGSVFAPMAMNVLASMGVAEATGVWLALAAGTTAVAIAASLAIAVTIRPAMRLPPSDLLRAE